MSPWIPKRPFERQKLFHWCLFCLMLAGGVFVLLFILQDALCALLGWPLPGEG